MHSSLTRRDWLRFTGAAGLALAMPGRGYFAAEEAGELIIRSQDPRNAEPPLAALVASAITPVKYFYVRSHGPTPKIDAGEFRLRIEGLVDKPLDFSLGELLGRFPPGATEATLTCAGNRRREMSATQPTPGVQWDAGAIGHARWSGVLLADVLRSAGLKSSARHVWFLGRDEIKEKDHSEPFGGSIPLDSLLLDRALASPSGPLLADKMNGEPLTVDHGFPLRAVVPGYIGARSVKWLTKIVVSDRPSPNHFVAKAYKIIRTDDPAELDAAQPIYEFPINAAICSPAPEAKVRAGKVVVAGYALPPGEQDATIGKVEISPDGGVTWHKAELLGESAPLCWRLWRAELELPAGKHVLVARATDNRGHVQPETCQWNAKGYLYNAWHHCPLEVA